VGTDASWARSHLLLLAWQRLGSAGGKAACSVTHRGLHAVDAFIMLSTPSSCCLRLLRAVDAFTPLMPSSRHRWLHTVDAFFTPSMPSRCRCHPLPSMPSHRYLLHTVDAFFTPSMPSSCQHCLHAFDAFMPLMHSSCHQCLLCAVNAFFTPSIPSHH